MLAGIVEVPVDTASDTVDDGVGVSDDMIMMLMVKGRHVSRLRRDH